MGVEESERWDAVQRRDRQFDGTFVYAVRTTGIYCRPSCTSRRPNPENVAYFDGPQLAERAGFRACLRCQPGLASSEPLLARIAEVCRYLEEPRENLPSLRELGVRFAISPHHLQRQFTRIVGVSPREYADSHRRARLKSQLRGGDSVTDALYNAGYGSSSGFYGQAAAALGMKPVTYRKGGESMSIVYTIAPCRLGYLLVGATERGVCTISLGDGEAALITGLGAEFPGARLERQEGAFGSWMAALLASIDGQRVDLDLPLDIRATVFQRKVWEALRAIPHGSTRSYSQIAEAIGQPTAARAVAGACASNPVALAIPCHRVVREGGACSGYRWGTARKEALLDREAAAAVTDAATLVAPAV